MSLKPWSEESPALEPSVALPDAVEATIARARLLTPDEIALLDAVDRDSNAGARRTAWDLLRAAVDRHPVLRSQRLVAREQAWSAVAAAAAAAGLEPPRDDGYWQVGMAPAMGAARTARYHACAQFGILMVDSEVIELLLEPWTRLSAAGMELRTSTPQGTDYDHLVDDADEWSTVEVSHPVAFVFNEGVDGQRVNAAVAVAARWGPDAWRITARADSTIVHVSYTWDAIVAAGIRPDRLEHRRGFVWRGQARIPAELATAGVEVVEVPAVLPPGYWGSSSASSG